MKAEASGAYISRCAMDDDERRRALQEALFCEQVLAKTKESVVLATLAGSADVKQWDHFPPGDVFDPESGAQWYYHSHPSPDAREHGHFHCFLRPAGKDGPIHHLVAIGVDSKGRLLRLFTVNHWVTGDDWLPATALEPFLARFDVHLNRPSYLVNRWLTGVVRLYEDEIRALLHERDAHLARYAEQTRQAGLDDRSLEVLSSLPVDLGQTARKLLG